MASRFVEHVRKTFVFVGKVLAVTLVLGALSTPVRADDWGGWNNNQNNNNTNCQPTPPPPPPCNNGGGNVPEIDPGSAASAMTLLGGGLLVLRSRFRRSYTGRGLI